MRSRTVKFYLYFYFTSSRVPHFWSFLRRCFTSARSILYSIATSLSCEICNIICKINYEHKDYYFLRRHLLLFLGANIGIKCNTKIYKRIISLTYFSTKGSAGSYISFRSCMSFCSNASRTCVSTGLISLSLPFLKPIKPNLSLLKE